jgi:hypothetical protein
MPTEGSNLTAIEQDFQKLVDQLGSEHPQTRLVRSNLAIQYRNIGQPHRADALFAQVAVCEHLRPVLDYIRSEGVRVLDVCTPWSRNCRNWVYFDNIVLDPESLKTRFQLPDFVTVHSHRGTVDGAEQGLVCSIDHDALMGLHPDLAASTRLIV